MTAIHLIGSGLALFILPGDRFINATKPLRIAEASAPLPKTTRTVK